MVSETANRSASRLPTLLAEGMRAYGAILGMVLVFIIIACVKPSFGHAANIENVLRQCTVLLMMSLGLTLVLAMRGVDLCIAQTVDASSIMAAGLLVHGAPVWLAFTAPILLGLVIGALNGALTAYLGIPAIIATLGTMFIVRSGELIYTHGSDPQILFTLPDSTTRLFFFLGRHAVAGVPVLIILAAIVFAAACLLATKTAFGRQARAVGFNVRAAYLAGIDIRRVFATGFVFSGLCAAIAGVAMVSRTGIAMPRGAEPLLLDAFTAVYLGTLASRSGAMTMPGTLVGTLFVSFLSNGLTMLGLGAPFRFTLNGLFILLAMAVGALRRPH